MSTGTTAMADDGESAGMDTRLERFIRRMPKVELHVHLAGAICPGTLLELAARYGVSLPASVQGAEAGVGPRLVYRDFDEFIDLFVAAVRCVQAAEDYERVVYELGAELARQRCRYAEVAFSPSSRRSRGVPHERYFAGLQRGRARARADFGVAINWIFDITRWWKTDPTQTHPLADYATAVAIEGREIGVVALGLGGDEAGAPPEPFAPYFERARAAGLRGAPHAGEMAGPASVWGALRALGAERIAHGVRAVEDPELLASLATQRIGCDVCPTSNVCLGVYPSVAQHPLRRLLDAGVPVTLNSDDPALFGTTLTGECLALARTQGFTAGELATCVRTGVDVSFLPDAAKAALRARVEAELAAAAREAGVDL